MEILLGILAVFFFLYEAYSIVNVDKVMRMHLTVEKELDEVKSGEKLSTDIGLLVNINIFYVIWCIIGLFYSSFIPCIILIFVSIGIPTKYRLSKKSVFLFDCLASVLCCAAAAYLLLF